MPLLPMGAAPTPTGTLTTAGKIKFITQGATGITSIRWASTPSATLYDMTVDDAGVVTMTAVATSSTTGTPIGLLLALTYAA